jgi:tyrosyl-tRNA synthetase
MSQKLQNYSQNNILLSEELELKYNLITRNLQEVIGKNKLIQIIEQRDLKVYWGTSPTGRCHIGYICPILKIADLLDAGCEVTILIADLHAFLDSTKSSLEQLSCRTQYYKIILTELLKQLNINIENSKLKFVIGTDFQLTKQYTMDMYKAHTFVNLHDAIHSGSEVVKQNDNPMMTSLLYPTLQALDEQYLNIDAQLGGVDQRKIMMHSKNLLPKLGYESKIALMNPMIPGLSKVAKITKTNSSIKMSSSDSSVSKIDLLDSKKDISKKINSTYCLSGDIDDNTLLILVKTIIFGILERNINTQFKINRSEKYGGPITYFNFETLKTDFENMKLYPADLKLGISDFLNNFLQPIRTKFEEPDMMSLLKNAYC